MTKSPYILYASEPDLDALEFCRVLEESGFGGAHGELRLKAMLNHADLVLSARLDRPDRKLIGVLRGLTDFSWVCYISELVVSKSAQGLGVGRGLVDDARRQLGPNVAIALISEPGAVGFYERIGMMRIPAAFWFSRVS